MSLMMDAAASTGRSGRTRRAERAARRAELSGSGPTREEVAPARFPGARAKFALFGEVLLTGLLVTLAGILVITLPAALAAGIRHLRRFIAAEDSRVGLFWTDVARAVLPGLAVGAGAVVLALILLLDIDVARSGFLPGGAVIEVVGWAGLGALALALLIAAGAWTPEAGWRGALRAVPGLVRADLPGALYVVATAVFVGVVTWALPPLFIPAIGCAALAVVAIPERRRGR
ncbi:hypothetical protein [Microbacterium invictum]|uniref:DUF624 domain-containing protein n=1 Tax=Microbacterium invictum TaxID=515415 RepID=A0AA40SRS0_9MICO|nr:MULTISPECIES: hypothetical protein [Microbacterium]MBB4141208.1 hypothetical protein [Microbacterium invictum]